MAYDEDARALVRLEKYRLFALVAAIALLIVSIAFEIEWLAWPRALAWSAAGVIMILETRILKRMGRDADAGYLWAAIYFLIALLCLL